MTSTLFAKLAKAKRNFSKVKKGTQAFGYKYADLTQVIESIQEPMLSENIDFVQQILDNKLVTSLVDLETGEQRTMCEVEIIIDNSKSQKNPMQAYGSGITYLRRYSILTAFGLAPEDDDGQDTNVRAPSQKFNKDDLKIRFMSGADKLKKFNLSQQDALDHVGLVTLDDVTQAHLDKLIALYKTLSNQ